MRNFIHFEHKKNSKTKPKRERHILAIGGYHFRKRNRLLENYLLAMSSQPKPRVCFLPTASAESPEEIEKFYQAFHSLPCEARHLELTEGDLKSVEKQILQNDILLVGGGSTKRLLAVWRRFDLEKVFKKAWQKGIVLAGISAGSLCWFEEGVAQSHKGLDVVKGLGVLKGSHCVHYDRQKKRRKVYSEFLKQKKIKSGFAVEDGVALHFINKKLYKVVSTKKNASAYLVSCHKEVQEQGLLPEFLGRC